MRWIGLSQCSHCEESGFCALFGDSAHWEASQEVLDYVSRWHSEHPTGRIIIWSGGGQEYAQLWGDRLLPEIPFRAMSKHRIFRAVGDTFIDDSPSPDFAAYCIRPWDLPGH